MIRNKCKMICICLLAIGSVSLGSANVQARPKIYDKMQVKNNLLKQTKENVYLSGSAQITVNQELELNLGVNLEEQLNDNYAAEVFINYDSEYFDFVEITSIDENVILKIKKDDNGRIRVLIATKGTKIQSTDKLLNIKLKALKQSDKQEIAVGKFNIANSEGNISELEGSSKIIKVISEDSQNIKVSKIENLKTDEIESDSISLKWDNPTSKVGLSGFAIYKDGKKIDSIDKDSNIYLISNLNENSIYSFKVTALYSNGKESKPQSITVRTKKQSIFSKFISSFN